MAATSRVYTLLVRSGVADDDGGARVYMMDERRARNDGSEDCGTRKMVAHTGQRSRNDGNR